MIDSIDQNTATLESKLEEQQLITVEQFRQNNANPVRRKTLAEEQQTLLEGKSIMGLIVNDLFRDCSSLIRRIRGFNPLHP